MSFKNIRIKMKGGKSRTQRVKVLASGKYKFVKNIGRKITRRRSSPKRRSPRTRRSRNPSTRRKGGKRMGKNITGQVYKWIRIGALAAPAVSRLLDPATQPKEKLERIMQDYTGYNPYDRTFSFEHLAQGWMPYIGAVLTTYGIPKLISIIRRL